MIFREKRDRNIKVWPKVLHADTGLGQHGKANVKAKVFRIVRPGAGVQVEDDVVFATIPQGKVLDFCFQVVHILGGKLVSVQSVQTQDKHACLSWVRCMEPGPFNRGQDVLITLRHLFPFLLGVDVNFKSIPLTQGEVKTGLHPAAFCSVHACDCVPLLPRRYVFIVIVAPILLLETEMLQVPREATPPRPGVIAGEAAVITPVGTPSGQRDLYPPETEQQNKTRTGGEQD